MSEAYERPERRALAEVENLVRHAMEEAGGLAPPLPARRGRVAGVAVARSGGKAPDPVQARARLAELEQENVVLQQRLAAVREKVTALSSRLAFLERGMAETT